MRTELAVPGRYQLRAAAVEAHASWWQLFAIWLGDRWNEFAHRFFPHLRVNAHTASIAGDVVVLLCVVIVAFTAAQLLSSLQLARERRASIGTLQSSARSAHALVVAAMREAENGAYGSAVRLLFAAGVTLLDLRGVVHDERSTTINEVRRLLRVRNASAEVPFIDLACIYTNVAYAERPVNAALWEDAKAAYERLSESVRT